MSSPAKYTTVAIVLHWLVAVLITTNLCLVWVVDSLPDDLTRPVIDTHKSIGITVLGLAVLRLLWRVAHRPPALPDSYARWERISAAAAHGSFYALMLCLPLSGWMHDSAWKDAATHPMQLYGLLPWPRMGWIMNLDPAFKETLHDVFGLIHHYLAYVLYALLILHIGAALKHQFLDREPEIQRMLP
jgi:cytochrome b561